MAVKACQAYIGKGIIENFEQKYRRPTKLELASILRKLKEQRTCVQAKINLLDTYSQS